MGGHNAGEVASHLAVEAIRDFVVESASGDLTWPFAYEPAYSPESNRLLTRSGWPTGVFTSRAARITAMEGMGTTVVAFWRRATRSPSCRVGDSRIYRWRDGALEQMTNDDTWLATVHRACPTTAGPSRTIRCKHVLTSVVGTREDLRPDVARGSAEGRRSFRALQRRHPWSPRRRPPLPCCQGGRLAGAGWPRRWWTRRWRRRTSDNATAARHRGRLTGRILGRPSVRIIRVAGHVRRSFLLLVLVRWCARLWSACAAPTPAVPPAQSLAATLAPPSPATPAGGPGAPESSSSATASRPGSASTRLLSFPSLIQQRLDDARPAVRPWSMPASRATPRPVACAGWTGRCKATPRCWSWRWAATTACAACLRTN